MLYWRSVQIDDLNRMAKEERFNENRLSVGKAYTRVEIAGICNVTPPINSREWGGLREYLNCIVLFVTLDKKDFDSSIQYEDIFDDGGQTFFWESQNRSSQKTAVIQRIINQTPVLLFCRVINKVKSSTLPFIYVGHLNAENYEGKNPVSFEYTVEDFQDEPNVDLLELYLWRPNKPRRKRPIETSPERKARQVKKQAKLQAKKGQGYLVDAAKKKAIELHAMDVAKAHYEAKAYSVRDTSANFPYDFECTLGNELRRVEVKGTTQCFLSVNVTINEVTSARSEECETDLFIVHNIEITGKTPDYNASCGEIKLIENWYPEDVDLFATAFIYKVPAL